MKYNIKPKVRELTEKFVSIISAWDSIEAICLNETAAADMLDPYFAIILDVYYHETVPDTDERILAYPPHNVFETSPTGMKDRFLVGEIPVRIEYKPAARIDELTSIALHSGSDLWKIRGNGTYVFYRLVNSQPFFERTGWLKEQLSRLEMLPDVFWVRMRSFYQSSMEHYLLDFGASIMQDDPFNNMISAAYFIKYACAVLFMENGQFEPSHRGYQNQVASLTTLPDGFAGWFESFLRPDSELPPARKYEIAKLIVRSIVAL
ncbi:DUF4037 domain-containing protein [Brucepastera parasyntrophica]|uniref:DUF4037 domain-containing protein n=1 Tax=Brucepastera parasyntrophica TaxID=2880008 RepID=UPI00210C473A|nr:DUF4037 domain-containing protein [Brucepastera parasyntrophica]ULQ59558.1 DUF4037 domain-containing protein [Brucepastera parasyntrophica]